MITPWPSQIELAVQGYHILKEEMIVYLAMEERTGKTLTAILIAEMCSNVETVVVCTTAKALKGWEETLQNYIAIKDIHLTTYGKAGKLTIDPDLVILDEAHKYISGIPKPARGRVKPSATWLAVNKITKDKPIIYLSATPHAQGYQMLYQQFALSTWSPFVGYKDFFVWFNRFGIPETIYVSGREVPQYTNVKASEVKPLVDHLFITKTRKELGFDFEPVDKVHYVELSEETKLAYNTLMKDKCLELEKDEWLIADTPMKLRCALHMLEGGGTKIGTQNEPIYRLLNNCEKINYIKAVWGDVSSVVVFYNYKVEKIKLENNFRHATILQATAYAEGVDLSEYETLIVYSQDFSTARHTQRRARQANRARDTEIIVHYLLVKDAVSEQVYETVSINKQNFVDSVFERVELC